MRINAVTTTFPDQKKKLSRQELDFVPDTGQEENVINLYPDIEDQIFEGFGGAFTESAAYVYHHMPQDDQEKVLKNYFAEEAMNYQLGRIPLDSCDFSLTQYEAMSDQDDQGLDSFSLNDMEKYILPLMRDVKRVTGKEIEFMISPWSPPAFMKTNRQRSEGGKLLKEYAGLWAEYICKYIKEVEKKGFTVRRMSIQNEPKAVQIWDSCVYDPQEEREFMKDYLYPALIKNGLTQVEIFIWDHNKERAYERACEMIDAETDHMVAGVAFHWYSGDHFEALQLIRKRFPGKKLILSEACIEYSKFQASDGLKNAVRYAHDLIGNLNSGMNAFYDWNLILDQQGGPNHVGNYCDAPYLYDMEQRELRERNTLAYIWHFSHFIKPGAIRVAYSKYTDKLEMTVFKNPDDSLSLVILNPLCTEQTVCLRLNGEMVLLEILGESISSMVITRNEVPAA